MVVGRFSPASYWVSVTLKRGELAVKLPRSIKNISQLNLTGGRLDVGVDVGS